MSAREERAAGPLTVFISYRRSDAAGTAGRIHDSLAKRFGDEHVFMDVGSIRPGEDFTEVLADVLDRCTAVVVVIGPGWVAATEKDGRRRLEDPRDYVRTEVARALSAGVSVFPVLVDGATMPRAEDLPPDLQSLTTRQAIEISATRYKYDVGQLVAALRHLHRPWWRTGAGRAALAVAAAGAVVTGALLWPDGGDDGGAGAEESTATGATGGQGTTGTETATATEEPTAELLRVRVNFQMPASETPEGYLADFGEPFGPREGPDQGEGLTYGWVHQGTHDPYDMVGKGRDRNTPGIEQRRDTLMHMQAGDPGSWEIAVPDGRYAVDVSVGDAAPTGAHSINVEGVPVISDFTGTAELYEENGTQVEVTDGVLTVDCVGGQNTKINYVHVTQLPSA
jgi:hypothetical protein